MQFGYAGIALVIIAMSCGVVETQSPNTLIITAPLCFQITSLLPADVELGTINEVGVNHNGEGELGSFLSEVCQIDVLMQPSPDIAGYANFQRVFGNILHFAAAEVLCASFLAGWKDGVVAQK